MSSRNTVLSISLENREISPYAFDNEVPPNPKTEADWIQAGRRVFDEATTPHLTVFDPEVIGKLRSREFMEAQRAAPLPDGSLGTLRWVPTKHGVGLSTLICGGRHILFRSDGIRIPGLSASPGCDRSKPGYTHYSGVAISQDNRLWNTRE